MANAPAPPKPAATPAEFAHRPARVALRISRAANGNRAVALAERLVEAFATMALIRRYEASGGWCPCPNATKLSDRWRGCIESGAHLSSCGCRGPFAICSSHSLRLVIRRHGRPISSRT